mgnify:CR=1 FL=1
MTMTVSIPADTAAKVQETLGTDTCDGCESEPVPTPDATPETTPETTPDAVSPVAEATPESTPKATPAATPDAMPEPPPAPLLAANVPGAHALCCVLPVTAK